MTKQIKNILSKDELDEWESCKKENYKSNVVLQDYEFTVDFNYEHYLNLVGKDKISYDDYLDLQRVTFYENLKTSFMACFYNMGFGYFCGKITKKTYNRICFNYIFISSIYPDGIIFSGKEEHVWMDEKGFEKFKVGDCVSFFAETYIYIKTGNGKELDFGIRNPKDIKKIKEYELPSDRDLANEAINELMYDTCDVAEFGLSHDEIYMLRKSKFKQRKKDFNKILGVEKLCNKREHIKEEEI